MRLKPYIAALQQYPERPEHPLPLAVIRAE